MSEFKLVSKFNPKSDQHKAITKLSNGFMSGNNMQTLLGVTGSGKTFTMANIIEKIQKPTLIIAHNKTLAGQLYEEFKDFFPDNAVEYFISYYDYYQPEAYIPSKDTYIAKDSSLNDEIDRMRHSATASLCERNDVIVVASVSCIYGLGSPIDYKKMTLSIRPGQIKKRDDVILKLVELQYTRSDLELKRGTFRARGDILEVCSANNSSEAYRVEFFGDEIDRISKIDILTGNKISEMNHIVIFSASHYIVDEFNLKRAISDIENELDERINYYKKNDRLIEAQRIEERTRFDIEMLIETGTCSGIENYSRHLIGGKPGQAPFTLIDYFPKDFLIIVDESHRTIPQIGAMYNGDRSRKQTLVDYGFRLPSALDNRPLSFEEFENKIDQMLFVSATPGEYEDTHEVDRAEQIIRPTGLLDPKIEVKPIKGQIDDILEQIQIEISNKGKILITTLTKKMAEDLTDYLKDNDVRVKYLHSDIDALQRGKIIRDLRLDMFDVLVGINLLREGLDIPEVSLVAILDADKEGFLRSKTSLIQTIGRAARNSEGRVIMYADNITDSMREAITETNRRRKIQEKYNKDNNISPQTIKKEVKDIILITKKIEKSSSMIEKDPESMSKKEIEELIDKIEDQMLKAASELDFEQAAYFRDQLKKIKKVYYERKRS